MNALQKRDAVMLLLGLVIFAVLYGLMEAGVIGSFWKLNILIIGVNIIMAASLNLINGYTGQFSLGHAGFMAVGAYVSVVLTANLHVPFLVALLAGGAAAGGVLVGVYYNSIDPLMGIMPGLKAFVAAVLGGIGSLPGAVVGGLILGVIEAFVSGFLSSTFRDAAAFAILILVLLFRPSGIFGRDAQEKV